MFLNVSFDTLLHPFGCLLPLLGSTLSFDSSLSLTALLDRSACLSSYHSSVVKVHALRRQKTDAHAAVRCSSAPSSPDDCLAVLSSLPMDACPAAFGLACEVRILQSAPHFVKGFARDVWCLLVGSSALARRSQPAAPSAWLSDIFRSGSGSYSITFLPLVKGFRKNWLG